MQRVFTYLLLCRYGSSYPLNSLPVYHEDVYLIHIVHPVSFLQVTIIPCASSRVFHANESVRMIKVTRMQHIIDVNSTHRRTVII